MASDERDVPLTVVLHVYLFIFVLIVVFFGGFRLVGPWSDEGLMGAAFQLLISAPLLLLGISIMVSVILLVLRRRAFYVPLLAGVAVVACAVAGGVILSLV